MAAESSTTWDELLGQWSGRWPRPGYIINTCTVKFMAIWCAPSFCKFKGFPPKVFLA